MLILDSTLASEEMEFWSGKLTIESGRENVEMALSYSPSRDAKTGAWKAKSH